LFFESFSRLIGPFLLVASDKLFELALTGVVAIGSNLKKLLLNVSE